MKIRTDAVLQAQKKNTERYTTTAEAQTGEPAQRTQNQGDPTQRPEIKWYFPKLIYLNIV